MLYFVGIGSGLLVYVVSMTDGLLDMILFGIVLGMFYQVGGYFLICCVSWTLLITT